MSVVDVGNIRTEKMIKQMERRIAKVYRTASEEAEKKAQAYFRQFQFADSEKRKLLQRGYITSEEYKKWQADELLQSKNWARISDQLARDYWQADKIARNVIDGYKPEAYAENFNFATYEVEKLGQLNTSFTLYNREAVERIWRDDPKLLPDPSEEQIRRLAEEKAVRWHKQQLQSVVTQSILQGESIDHMAQRISRTLGVSNTANSVRYARTAMTGAQNAGRQDAFIRMANLGVQIKREWHAVYDKRTRHEHRLLDGQVREIDEPFEVDGEEIMYPGDPDAPGYLVWNCRCRENAVFEGLEDRAGALRSNEEIGSYDEWKNELAKKQPEQITTTIQRPDNEQEVLKQFDFVGERNTADILKQTNPNFYTVGGREWRNNCQRTVVAEELCCRGYNVTAKAYNANDPIKNQGPASWLFEGGKAWYNDKDVRVVPKKSKFKSVIAESMDEWGEGARAVVRVKWNRNYGGNGHFIFAQNTKDGIVYSDPQVGHFVDIDDKLKQCTTGANQMWVMRVDNRQLSENVIYAVENYRG